MNQAALQLNENQVLVQLWVSKKLERTHQWNRRWAVLRGCQLSYYKNELEHKPNRVLRPGDVLAYSCRDQTFVLHTRKRDFEFSVEAASEQWRRSLEKAFGHKEGRGDKAGEGHDDEAGEGHEGQEGHEAGAGEAESEGSADAEYLVEEGRLALRRHYNQWKDVYVVVTNWCVYFCKTSDKTVPERTVPVSELADVVEVDDVRGRRWCLMLIGEKRYYLSAQSEREMTLWLSAIKAAIALRG